MDITPEELSSIEKAFEKQEFRDLFNEYVTEISVRILPPFFPRSAFYLPPCSLVLIFPGLPLLMPPLALPFSCHPPLVLLGRGVGFKAP
jgi:hypothetical protein